MAIATAKVRIEGACPLLLHSPKLANPLDPLTKEMKKITAKRKKTDADYEMMSKLEYLGGLYENDEGIQIPSTVIEGCIRSGATISRKGKDVQSSLSVYPIDVPLIYDGPKTGEALFRSGKFIDVRGVKVKNSRIMRTRPRFNNWALEFEIIIDDDTISKEDVFTFLEDGGRKKGICDFRPVFGRFTVASISWNGRERRT